MAAMTCHGTPCGLPILVYRSLWSTMRLTIASTSATRAGRIAQDLHKSTYSFESVFVRFMPVSRSGRTSDLPSVVGRLLCSLKRPPRRSSSGRRAVELRPPRAVGPRRPSRLLRCVGAGAPLRSEILGETSLWLVRHERDRDCPFVHLDPVPVDERPAGRGRGSLLEDAVPLHGGGNEELVRAVRDVVARPADRRDALLQDRHMQADARIFGPPLHGPAGRDSLAAPQDCQFVVEPTLHLVTPPTVLIA